MRMFATEGPKDQWKVAQNNGQTKKSQSGPQGVQGIQSVQGAQSTEFVQSAANAHNGPNVQTPPEAFDESIEFTKSERAYQAQEINLSAKLSVRRISDKRTGGMKEIRRLFSLAKRERGSLAIAISFLLISSCVSMTLPFAVGKILDAANSPDPNITIFDLTLTQFFLSMAGLFAVGSAANFGRIVTLRVIGERLVARLRVLLFKRTISQDAEFFDANRVGDLISRLTSDTNIVSKSVTQNVSDGMRSFITAVGGVSLMCYVSLELTSMILVIAPPLVLGTWLYGRKVRQLSRNLQEAVGSLTKVSEERLSNVRTSQAFAGERQEIARYSDRIRDVFSIGKKEAVASGIFFASSGLVGNLTILILLGIGSDLVSKGAMTVGDLTTFTMYAGFCGSAAYGLGGFYSELMKGTGAATRLFELMDRKPSIHTTIGIPMKSARDHIAFEHVKFAYPTRPAVTIFNDLTFTIPPGSNVCIVGQSGGGKSTITSLLLRFYDPVSGSIKIGGTDIRDMNLKSLRRQIGVVSQEPVLFGGTIAENIAYGLPGATRKDIVRAAMKANCSFISDFPDGLDTYVGSRGGQLSGGQKQRIAIARALIKNPSILILDEATSALDSESESAVNEALSNLMKENCTTISIAHRLSTIKRSDQVIVLGEGGFVREHGKFAELYADPNSALSQLLLQKEDILPINISTENKPDHLEDFGKETPEEMEADYEEQELEFEMEGEFEDEQINETKRI